MRFAKLNKVNFNKLLVLVSFLFCLFFIFYVLYTYIFFEPNQIKFATSSIKIYDKNETFLREISQDNAVRNTPVDINQVPEACKNALISIEDKTYYSNIGIDSNGLGRLMISFLTRGSLGGGSTISQQVIKNYFNNIYNRNPLDKLREMIFAVKLNQFYSKDKILEMYLNNVYFGDFNYGIGSAAKNYFGKEVSELNLSECAYLAGIPQWPGVYNPHGNLLKGKNRQTQVLEAMARDGLISEVTKSYLIDSKLNFKLTQLEVRAPHYIEYLQNNYDFYNGNYLPSAEFHTTYNYETHKAVLKILKIDISKFNIDKLNNAAVVMFNKNKLELMIGSQDFFNDEINGKFNSALGLRQPGNGLTPLFKNYLVDNGIVHNNFLQNDLADKYSTSFEIYLRKLTNDNQKELCDTRFLSEGCEISIFDLSRVYHKLLNGYQYVSDIKSEITEIEQLDKDIELSNFFLDASISYSDYKILLTTTSNLKDTFAIATNGEYTIGVWLGNTEGEEVFGLTPENTSQILMEDIIDYINKK